MSVVRINGRSLISSSIDPDGLAAACARLLGTTSETPQVGLEDCPNIDHILTIAAESSKGIGVFADDDLPPGIHVGWIFGTVSTTTVPSKRGDVCSFELCESPAAYVNFDASGSLATFINEDILAPNCVANLVLFQEEVRVRVTTTRAIPRGTALSMNYRTNVSTAALLRERELHSWGRALTSNGSLCTNTYMCANRRYHCAPMKPPSTSMLCVECSAQHGRSVAFCGSACFLSHVADYASSDHRDRAFCAPFDSNRAKAVVTKKVTPRKAFRGK
jgi:hypothetical protein